VLRLAEENLRLAEESLRLIEESLSTLRKLEWLKRACTAEESLYS
jgi:hypothetical protein